MREAQKQDILKPFTDGMDGDLQAVLLNVASALQIASNRIREYNSLTDDERKIVAAYRASNDSVKLTIRNALGIRTKDQIDKDIFEEASKLFDRCKSQF